MPWDNQRLTDVARMCPEAARLTGTARGGTDALLINACDMDGFADALAPGRTMAEEEQERRMRHFEGQNIYRRAGQLLSCRTKFVKAAACA